MDDDHGTYGAYHADNAWFIVKKLFPFSQKNIELNIEGNIQWNWRTYVVASHLDLPYFCGLQENLSSASMLTPSRCYPSPYLLSLSN